MASILGIPADMYDPARDIGLDLIHYVQESYDGKKIEYPVVMPEKLMKGVQRVSY